MTIFDMLEQSGVLTLFGMGIVFGFLIILVFAITGTGMFITKFVKQEEVKPAGSSAVKSGNNGETTAAISAAVNQYRKNK